MLRSLSILRMNALELQEFVNELLLENPMVDVLPAKADSLSMIPQSWKYVELPSSKNELTLAEELRFQLRGIKCTATVRHALEYLIDSIDENGYLHLLVEDASALGFTSESMETALKLLHEMEPFGVGARSLSECLLLQLKHQPDSALAMRIAREHLTALANNNLAAISKALSCSMKQAEAAARQIRMCNPKPGNGYAPAEDTHYVVPDLYVFENEDNQLQILLNSKVCPYLRIDPYYQSLLSTQEDIRQYLQAKIQEASASIRHIARRNLTLMQCAQILVHEQEEFFRKGPHMLRTLSLQEVADRIEVSASTVSRALQGKHIRCIWGMIPMKMLLQRGASSEEHVSEWSAAQLLAELKRLISEEDKKQPLSDQTIAERLEEKGVRISRRTVAKYRIRAGIPAAAQRRVR